jgi:hypothetical protein
MASTPNDSADVYKPVVRQTGPAITTVHNETTTKSGTVYGEKRDYITV